MAQTNHDEIEFEHQVRRCIAYVVILCGGRGSLIVSWVGIFMYTLAFGGVFDLMIFFKTFRLFLFLIM